MSLKIRAIFSCDYQMPPPAEQKGLLYGEIDRCNVTEEAWMPTLMGEVHGWPLGWSSQHADWKRGIVEGHLCPRHTQLMARERP